MEKEMIILNDDDFYLKSKQKRKSAEEKFEEDNGKLDFIALYRVDEVTFEEKAPRKEALENVISSMNIRGINFVYIIVGDAHQVSFYYGVAKNYFKADSKELEITDIGNDILQPSLQGNFRGSKITALDADQKRELLKQIDAFKKVHVVEGVPGINKDDESFQAVDRLIDVMLGDEFAFVLIAKPLPLSRIQKIRSGMYNLYNEINPAARVSCQHSKGTSQSMTTTKTKGDTSTDGTNSSTGTSQNTGESTCKKKENSETTKTGGNSSTRTTGTTHSEAISHTDGKSEQTGSNIGDAETKEIVNKKIQDWIKYLDDVILPRLDYGAGRGLFVSNAVIMSNCKADIIKLGNAIRSIYGGESGNRMPLKAFELNEMEKSYVRRFQIPKIEIPAVSEEETWRREACSQVVLDDRAHCLLGYWLSSRELSLLAGLPQKEVVGLALREEVEFGLNVKPECENDDSVLLGYLIQNGMVLNGENHIPKIEIHYKKEYFDKHIFVTGVTGSGKTTTCQKLLLESGQSFMVIEPAKTEYRVLTETFDDMLVFTLGKETGAPFRLNPFEFLPGESITSRVDMIKASMEAAFDMEAAIPQILEAAIYKCYEKKGWDIASNRNTRYGHPFAGDVQAFPTLGDLENEIEAVVKEQGFDDRLKAEYIGSIRARLKGLTVGAKGLMLNTPRSLDFVELLDRQVVFELESIRSVAEKSLIMGFILINLSEAIRIKYSSTQKQIDHITLVEEAHRLLSKFEPGDSLNKKHGVEMFSDMLAEVRKYGESLIIADQIPNKLAPEVLKNTNTKIVHKLFAQDDKEAIGNTMALKKEQKEHLSYLEAGNAVMINPGLSKAIQIKVCQGEDNDTERIPPDDVTLRKRIMKFYADSYKQGFMPGLEGLKEKPDEKYVDEYFRYFQPSGSLVRLYRKYVKTCNPGVELINEIVNEVSADVGACGLDRVAEGIYRMYYVDKCKYQDEFKDLKVLLSRLLEGLLHERQSYKLRERMSEEEKDILEAINN